MLLYPLPCSCLLKENPNLAPPLPSLSPTHSAYTLREEHWFLGRGQRSKGVGKKKSSEKELEVIENQEFIEMKNTATFWPALTMEKKDLQELADQGLMQEQPLAEWKAPGSIGFQSSHPVRSFYLSLLSGLDCACLHRPFSTIFCATSASL